MRVRDGGMLVLTGLDELRDHDAFLYLASPYSRFIDGVDAAYLLVSDISDSLDRAGIEHFCPIKSSHEICARSGIDKVDHDFWMAVDRHFMERASGLIVAGLDGWEQSVGVCAERAYFCVAAKPIYFLDPAIILAGE